MNPNAVLDSDPGSGLELPHYFRLTFVASYANLTHLIAVV